ncbi:MAG: MFS transporter [Gammaproteobacteria bacterium]|nr:MFS transporter [Gammaproteobacteria bacterium]
MTESTFAASRRYRRYVLGLLLAVMTLNYADRYVIGILLPQIKSDLALTDTQIGFITGAAFTVFYALLGVPIASLADRRSRRKIIAVALALWSLMTCLCGLARSFVQLAVFRVLVGVGEAGCTPPSHSLISDYFAPRERAMAMAVLGLGSSLGVFLAFLVGGWITDAYGWRITLVSFGAPGVLIALIVYFTLRDPPRGHSDGLQVAEEAPRMYPAFRGLWAKGTFRYMVLGGSLYGMVSTALLAWLPSFYTRTHGLEVAAVGTWLAFTKALPHAAGTLLGGLLASRLAKFGTKPPIYLCAGVQLVAAPFYALVLLVPDPTAALLWLIVPACVGVMQGPILFATIQGVADIRTRAVASALMILIINLIAGVIGPQAVGVASDFLADSLGVNSLGVALLIVCVACSLGSAGLFYLASRSIEQDLQYSRAPIRGSDV